MALQAKLNAACVLVPFTKGSNTCHRKRESKQSRVSMLCEIKCHFDCIDLVFQTSAGQPKKPNFSVHAKG